MSRLDELKAMSATEINRIVAEKVMGWNYEGFCRRGPVFLDSCGIQHECQGVGGGIKSLSWNPSTDHNDAAMVRAEIERRGLVKQFVSVFWQCIDSQKVIGVSSEDYSSTCQWLKINATPRETCIAALLTVEV